MALLGNEVLYVNPIIDFQLSPILEQTTTQDIANLSNNKTGVFTGIVNSGLEVTAIYVGDGLSTPMGYNWTGAAASATHGEVGMQIAMTSNIGLGDVNAYKVAFTSSVIAGASSGPIYGSNVIMQGHAGAGGTFISAYEADIENIGGNAGTPGSTTASIGYTAVSVGSFSNTVAFWAVGDTIWQHGFHAQNSVDTAFSSEASGSVGLELSTATLSSYSIGLPNNKAILQRDSSNILRNIANIDGNSVLQIGYSGGTVNVNGTLKVGNTVLSTAAILIEVSGVNFNSANTDTVIPITLPTGYTRYLIAAVRISGASASLTTSTFGIFDAAAGGGSPVISSGTACTISSASDNTANNAMGPAVTSPTTLTRTAAGYPNIYFRVQTPQGSAATASVTLSILAVP